MIHIIIGLDQTQRADHMDSFIFNNSMVGGFGDLETTLKSSHYTIDPQTLQFSDFVNALELNGLTIENDPRHTQLVSLLDKPNLIDVPFELAQEQLEVTIPDFSPENAMDYEISMD